MPFRLGERLRVLGIGHGFAEVLNHIFDFAGYGSAVWFLGPLWGAVVMVPLSLIWDFCFIKKYSDTERDWFGFETLKKAAASAERWDTKVAMHGAIAILYIFFAWWDPPRAVVLVRGRLAEGKFTRADWKWLLLTNLTSNAVWIFTVAKAVGYLQGWF